MTGVDTTGSVLEQVLAAAASAAGPYGASAPATRAQLLRAAADALDDAGERLVPVAAEETALPEARLVAELARTTFQLRATADRVMEGRCFEAVIEHADPDAPLGPRPDLRRVSEPIGPVLVFAASNFPFAFSVAGGDTATALGAGCPVVVKAHPGHPLLSDLVGDVLTEVGLPVAVVHGVDTGTTALRDPRVRAAAFTGSTAGGRALFDVAASRPDPIPFHGELGSVNPVVVTPGAVRARGAEVVDGFVASFTLGVGQFCTKPGLLFLPAGHGLEGRLVDAVRAVGPAPMLGDRIRDRYEQLLGTRRRHETLRTLVAGDGTAPTLLACDTSALLADPSLLEEECFGPASIVVSYEDDAALLAALAELRGSLTATVHSEPGEEDRVRPVLDVLRPRAGRIVHDGWPTGVAVSEAMHHGGPWPASTSPLHGSVGGNAIARFLVPRCYQDVPDTLLPPSLRRSNPWGIVRRVDGGEQRA